MLKYYSCLFLNKETDAQVNLELTKGHTGSKQWSWDATCFLVPWRSRSSQRITAVRARLESDGTGAGEWRKSPRLARQSFLDMP